MKTPSQHSTGALGRRQMSNWNQTSMKFPHMWIYEKVLIKHGRKILGIDVIKVFSFCVCWLKSISLSGRLCNRRLVVGDCIFRDQLLMALDLAKSLIPSFRPATSVWCFDRQQPGLHWVGRWFSCCINAELFGELWNDMPTWAHSHSFQTLPCWL